MTDEQKEILIKDLCARLPYGVKITDGLHTVTLKVRIDTAPATLAQFIHSENLRYYLRPMSSMTEEERKEYFDFRNQELQRVAFAEVGRESAIAEISDWLNEHHFDYRGLIPMGLALEAKEGMYD